MTATLRTAAALTTTVLTTTVLTTTVLTAAVLTTPADAAVNHNPVGWVDSATFTRGHLSVSGWALDPDTRAPVKVQVRVDNRAVVTVPATATRADVGRRYPHNGAVHGFSAHFTAPDGRHTVCVIGINRGLGHNRAIGCRTVVVNNNPVGGFDQIYQTPQGETLSGWLVDPNSSASITAVLTVDGRTVARAPANQARPTRYSASYGQRHGFAVAAALSSGTHRVCLVAVNVGAGTTNPTIGCQSVRIDHDPVGVLNPVTRVAGSQTAATLTGYALDLDTVYAISVQATVDGVAQPTVLATSVSAAATAAYPRYSRAHGFAIAVQVPDANQHQVCLTLTNVGSGADRTLPCQQVASTGDLTPGPPIGTTGWPGNGKADISWSPSRSVGHPLLNYTVSALPDGQVVTVAPTTNRVTITGLRNGHGYTFVVTPHNSLGAGTAATVLVIPSYLPAQLSPAPVSTSHYPRNLHGNLAVDTAMARAQGVRDAVANPSGHRYTILQDIGGQDQADGGVLLSATSIFQSYSHVLAVMQAYTDGYASQQRSYAPLLLAIGTNNDIDVSATSGASWARAVINPLSAYVSAHHPNIEVAGADDIEPGFSANAAQSRSWLSGYLAATSARFVFNGSADGCSVSAPNSGCNNRWRMADLQWLSGGASPARIISLPQIYNYAMPLQWKFISMTGVLAHQPKIYFGGPLTEYTACGGGTRCYSIGGHTAWTLLWNAIQSSAATHQSELPYSTDLMIN